MLGLGLPSPLLLKMGAFAAYLQRSGLPPTVASQKSEYLVHAANARPTVVLGCPINIPTPVGAFNLSSAC